MRKSVVIFVTMLIGCSSPSASSRPVENAYADKTEAAVRLDLGTPHLVFAGHYAAPPDDFTKQFTGEVKTLVFKQPGGEYYVSFEKLPTGWISICSSWLPDGAAF